MISSKDKIDKSRKLFLRFSRELLGKVFVLYVCISSRFSISVSRSLSRARARTHACNIGQRLCQRRAPPTMLLSLTRLDRRHPSPREWATGTAPVPPIPSCWSRSCETAACLCARHARSGENYGEGNGVPFVLAFTETRSLPRATLHLQVVAVAATNSSQHSTDEHKSLTRSQRAHLDPPDRSRRTIEWASSRYSISLSIRYFFHVRYIEHRPANENGLKWIENFNPF